MKLALENNNFNIFNYLLNLPDIKIGHNCFKNCLELTQFKVPPTMTFIGDYAFYDCGSLIDITIPPSVTSFEDFCFAGCVLLKNIQIPSSLLHIGKNAFEKCISLEKMIIPSSVISIGDNFISECINLNSITIPSSVKNIGRLHFIDFSLLKEFTIPPSVTKIYENAFCGCSSLLKIEIPSSVTHIEKYAFCRCKSLTQISIPPSITSIEEGTFSECDSLNMINIPDSVKSIGFNAFYGCQSLVNIAIPSSVNKIGSTAFKECTSLKKIIYKNDLQKLEIVTNILKIFKYIFMGDTNSGKSCFLTRFENDVFQENTQPTIGASYISLNANFQGNEIHVRIWDTSGQERYKALTPMYISGSNGCAIFFDINNPDSFNKVEYYLELIVNRYDPMTLVLIGNKCDLEHNVSDNDIKKLEKKYNAKYFEVSAKNGYNVKDVMNYLISEVFRIILEDKDKILNLICND